MAVPCGVCRAAKDRFAYPGGYWAAEEGVGPNTCCQWALSRRHETFPLPAFLDRAVLAATYAAGDAEGAWSEDWAEVWFDKGAGQALPGDHALAERRGEVDGSVLAHLLRMNLARSGQGDDAQVPAT